MQNITIFCGSKLGKNPLYQSQTVALATLLGQHHKHIIYGGGNSGLMGVVANTVLQHGGTVTGIIPTFLNSQERQHQGLTNLIVTDTMHQRKTILFEKSDAAIILPGGFGTLDELFELVTWNQLELHLIKVFIFNIDGFYTPLQQHIEMMYNQEFLYNKPSEGITYLNTASDILPFL